jgi:hypothetical protein
MNTHPSTASFAVQPHSREGSVRWLKAIDEAEAIGRELLSGGSPAAWSKRVDRLAARLDKLVWWKDDLDALVGISPTRGITMTIPLREAPALLRSLLNASPA